MSWTDLQSFFQSVAPLTFSLIKKFFGYIQRTPLLFYGFSIVIVLPLFGELIHMIASLGYPVLGLPSLKKVKFDKRRREYDKLRLEAYNNYLDRNSKIYQGHLQDKSESYSEFLTLKGDSYSDFLSNASQQLKRQSSSDDSAYKNLESYYYYHDIDRKAAKARLNRVEKQREPNLDIYVDDDINTEERST